MYKYILIILPYIWFAVAKLLLGEKYALDIDNVNSQILQRSLSNLILQIFGLHFQIQ